MARNYEKRHVTSCKPHRLNSRIRSNSILGSVETFREPGISSEMRFDRRIPSVAFLSCNCFFLQEDNALATDTVAVPEERGLETHGIERVSPTTRTHVRIFHNFTMW